MEAQLYEVLADHVAEQSGQLFDEPLSESIGKQTMGQLYLDSLSLMELSIRLEEELGILLDLNLAAVKPGDRAETLIGLIAESTRAT